MTHRPKSKLSRIFPVHVPDPFRSDKGHHNDDRVANRENGPQNTDRFRVSYVVGRVDLGRVDVFDFGTHDGRSGSILIKEKPFYTSTVVSTLFWA